jgi:magnesium transporter
LPNNPSSREQPAYVARTFGNLTGAEASVVVEVRKDKVDPELQRYLRDVQDHAIEVIERVAGFRDLLQNILSVNLTLVGLHQNEEVKALTEASIEQNNEVKKISAWAAILFAPTLVGTVYGMNFEYMPELQWVLG